MEEVPEFSAGTLLGGRIIYRQPAQGYRTGIEPVLLAASIPARPGDRVVEAGAGAGAGLLSLCARVRDLSCTGIERDPAMARLASANLAANTAAGTHIICASLEDFSPEGDYDHAFANPPWHADTSTPSPDPAKRGAKIATASTLDTWIGTLASMLRHRGTLTLILPAGQFAHAAAALTAAKCPEITLLPLWPKQRVPAKLVIVQAIRHGKGPDRVLPGLILHEADGAYTPDATRILRDAEPLL